MTETLTLEDITHQEAGIVIYPDHTAIVTNWSGREGLPKLFAQATIYYPSPIVVQDTREVTGVDIIELLTGVEIWGLEDEDELDVSDGGTLYELEDCVVIAPHGWN